VGATDAAATTRGRGARAAAVVADDGPGLPPGGADAVLRRGVRGPASTGDGLGLAVVADLVRRHRGRFVLHSSAAGCTAVIHLPMAGRPVRTAAVVS
jgi:signal transduction histidine kinase